MSKTTCGPLYQEAIARYAGDDLEKRRLFAAGFIHGEAEKVCLGACQGAMFHPSPEYNDMVYDLADDAARLYNLQGPFIFGQEIWLLRDITAVKNFNEMKAAEVNSQAWHFQRGTICGVPLREIDVNFHKRRGAGKPCDR